MSEVGAEVDWVFRITFDYALHGSVLVLIEAHHSQVLARVRVLALHGLDVAPRIALSFFF
ncbi:hypothetical protein [Verrucosispora sp. NA02020]|uniref:hypothetical protein n=1 Tax=Verrucosispora sp. NA02020 TaxID=2742132 RepID=UPI003D706432